MVEKLEIYRGSQWRVTRKGMERVGTNEFNGYFIERDDLTRGVSDVNASWPVHLAQKRWVDLEDFEAAYRAAIGHFGMEAPNIDEIFAAAREIRRGWPSGTPGVGVS